MIIRLTSLHGNVWGGLLVVMGTGTWVCDSDVAVIVPTYGGNKFELSKKLWRDVREVSFFIEPVLMAEDRQSPLYHDVMRTGVTV